uniref:Uncharacterized protein n=1 Tax=Rhizophagus irregularis (strain DAOM 181602 / DAOM 197198 / MUCL 43194) TaxID=747089 RepID=U9SG24_RHIID
MAFNQAYSDLLAKLPASLINEAWIRLTSRKPIRYQKRLMCQRRTQSWPECQTSLSFKEISTIYVADNGRTFEKFMHDIEKEYRERVNANKKLRCKIEDLKMQVQEAEKELASMKSDSTH